MKLICITAKATASEIDLAKRCMDLLEQPYQMYNIPQYRVEDIIFPGVFVVAFGLTPKLAVQQYVKTLDRPVRVLELPAFKKLVQSDENKEARQDTFDKLLALKEVLAQEQPEAEELKVTKEDLPDLDRYHLLALKKLMNNKQQSTTLRLSLNGRLVEIGDEQLEDSKADIFVHFEELYAVRCAMDVFNVKEVHLVRNSKNNTSKRS